MTGVTRNDLDPSGERRIDGKGIDEVGTDPKTSDAQVNGGARPRVTRHRT